MILACNDSDPFDSYSSGVECVKMHHKNENPKWIYIITKLNSEFTFFVTDSHLVPVKSLTSVNVLIDSKFSNIFLKTPSLVGGKRSKKPKTPLQRPGWPPNSVDPFSILFQLSCGSFRPCEASQHLKSWFHSKKYWSGIFNIFSHPTLPSQQTFCQQCEGWTLGYCSTCAWCRLWALSGLVHRSIPNCHQKHRFCAYLQYFAKLKFSQANTSQVSTTTLFIR